MTRRTLAASLLVLGLGVGTGNAFGESDPSGDGGSGAPADDRSAEPRGDQPSGRADSDTDTSNDTTTGDEADSSDGPTSEFSVGSYGRVQFDFDDRGNRGRQTNVVHHGPRLLEESYAELDLRYDLRTDDGFGARVLFTLALDAPFAHFSGNFTDQALAVRNLYVETRGLLPQIGDLELWVGSRMYRGDDVYLLDYWPVDELNTVGGGAVWRAGGFDLRAHVGVNRLNDDYQVQSIEVPGRSFATRRKVLLDRQRTIGSLRAAYEMQLTDDLSTKAVAYGEYHTLPGGRRIPSNLLEGDAPTYPESIAAEPIPGETGGVVGGQIGVFEPGSTNHLNLFFKMGRGLGAYGEFGVPVDTAADGTAGDAETIVGALSGNLESETFGLMAGGYLKRFRDGDDRRRDLDDYLEGALSLRPAIFITRHFHQAFELSYQSHHPFGLVPETGQHRIPSVLQVSALEIASLDRGNYARPQLRLQYTLSLSNEDARAAYPEGDVRRPDPVEHFVGIGAEWWFNSSRY